MAREQVIQEGGVRGFGGLRVVALESRMAGESSRLITKAGGIPIEAPTLRELPIEENPAAMEFADSLLAGRFDIVIFMTGVGTRYLFAAMETRHDRADLTAALAKTTVVARGPKPVAALRELGVPVVITVPEPNTWREMVGVLEESNEGVALQGARVAIQEYGISNDELTRALESAGASVTCVPAYRWALPEDLAPLKDAIRQILARTADVMLVTSATQIHHLLEVARGDGVEDELKSALTELIVASVGPVATENLRKLGISVDLEPAHPKLGTLIKEASQRAPELLLNKRSGIVRPRRERPAGSGDAQQSVFMRACRGEATEYTPVWLMRQAGRYMQEYREVRARLSFSELCKNPQAAAEVTVTAQERLGVDAAIIFSDILLIVEPMGLGLAYDHGEGPTISGNIKSGADVDALREITPSEELAFVFDAIRLTRAELDADVPLIGFCGAPFTLASYMIEGGGSRNYVSTKTLMYRDKGAWDALMKVLTRALVDYLRCQVDAGAQALQVFDSWVGCLSPADYRTYVLPHMTELFSKLPPDVPVIHFGTGTATLLDLQVSAGASVLGVDHRVEIGPVFERFPGVAIQGNLDPVALFAEPAYIRDTAEKVLDDVGGKPGHIFNLGHGILPATPVDNAIALVDAVHTLSAK